MEVRRYKHDAAYSYTLGMALTIELISQKDSYPIRKIYVHPDYVPKDNKYNIFKICNEAQLPIEINQKVFNRLSTKENVYVIGIFDKHDIYAGWEIQFEGYERIAAEKAIFSRHFY